MKKNLMIFPVIFAMFLLLPGAALANCFYLSGGPGAFNLNFGRVAFQRDAPVGTILARTSVLADGGQLRCPTPYTIEGRLGVFSNKNPLGSRTFDTNIPGVGIMLHIHGHMNLYVPFIYTDSARPDLVISATVTASLVKTSASSVGSGALATGVVGYTTHGTLRTLTISLVGNNTIEPMACSVTNTAINVPMGDLERDLLTGEGYEGPEVPFSIPLDCDAGTRVNFKIDATPDSSAAPGVMALNSSNGASGVGIKLTHSGTPITFGTDIPAGTSATAGNYNIPLTARYYQTHRVTRAGPANATATFTMTYQ